MGAGYHRVSVEVRGQLCRMVFSIYPDVDFGTKLRSPGLYSKNVYFHPILAALPSNSEALFQYSIWVLL